VNKLDSLQQSFDAHKRTTVDQALFGALFLRKDSLLRGLGLEIAGCSNEGFPEYCFSHEMSEISLCNGYAVVLDRASAFFFFDTFTTEPGRSGRPFCRDGVISRNHVPGMAGIKAPPAGEEASDEDPLPTH
jgi:hypothetical protein